MHQELTRLLPVLVNKGDHLDNILQNKTFNDQVAVQNAFEECIGSKTPEMCATGINKLISSWKKCDDSKWH